MNILLCSNIDTILSRWHQALSGTYRVSQATTMHELNSLVQKHSYDLLVIHTIMMKAQTLAQLLQLKPGMKLLVLTNRPEDSEGLDYMRAGAVGYANSYINSGRLQEAVKTIASGSVWVTQSLMNSLISGIKPRSNASENSNVTDEKKSRLTNLSKREHQIASLVAQGLSNLEIAEQLDITERTVKAHLSAVYSKTRSNGRLNLALLFHQN